MFKINIKSKGKWIYLDKAYADHNELPNKEGTYKVKMSMGSVNRKIVETESRLTFNNGYGRAHWSGTLDWNYVVAWWKEEFV